MGVEGPRGPPGVAVGGLAPGRWLPMVIGRVPGEFEEALGNGKLREQFELEVEEQASAALAREMARAESFRDDERKDRRAERPTNDE